MNLLSENATLATLKGSEKQITWAKEIRDRILPEAILARDEVAAKIQSEVATNPAQTEKGAEVIALMDQAIAKMSAETDSRYWIESRTFTGKSCLQMLARAIKLGVA